MYGGSLTNGIGELHCHHRIGILHSNSQYAGICRGCYRYFFLHLFITQIQSHSLYYFFQDKTALDQFRIVFGQLGAQLDIRIGNCIVFLLIQNINFSGGLIFGGDKQLCYQKGTQRSHNSHRYNQCQIMYQHQADFP